METEQYRPRDTSDLALCDLIDRLICDDRPLLSTTGTRAAIAAHDARLQGLETAIREMALEIDRLKHSS